MNWLTKTLINNDYVRAWLLSQARHIVTAVGAGLVAKGYADSAMVEGAAGLVVTAVGFYLSHLDVKNVDKKIAVAYNTEPLAPIPSPKMTPEEEIKYTQELNRTALRALGKAV